MSSALLLSIGWALGALTALVWNVSSIDRSLRRIAVALESQAKRPPIRPVPPGWLDTPPHPGRRP